MSLFDCIQRPLEISRAIGSRSGGAPEEAHAAVAKHFAEVFQDAKALMQVTHQAAPLARQRCKDRYFLPFYCLVLTAWPCCAGALPDAQKHRAGPGLSATSALQRHGGCTEWHAATWLSCNSCWQGTSHQQAFVGGGWPCPYLLILSWILFIVNVTVICSAIVQASYQSAPTCPM